MWGPFEDHYLDDGPGRENLFESKDWIYQHLHVILIYGLGGISERRVKESLGETTFKAIEDLLDLQSAKNWSDREWMIRQMKILQNIIQSRSIEVEGQSVYLDLFQLMALGYFVKEFINIIRFLRESESRFYHDQRSLDDLNRTYISISKIPEYLLFYFRNNLLGDEVYYSVDNPLGSEVLSYVERVLPFSRYRMKDLVEPERILLGIENLKQIITTGVITNNEERTIQLTHGQLLKLAYFIILFEIYIKIHNLEGFTEAIASLTSAYLSIDA